MNNCILIEGLPGSGKTTYAKRIKEYLESEGKKVELYQEGDLHPIDLAWCAILTKEKHQELLEKYSTYKDQINKYTKEWNDSFIVAYTKLRVEDQDASIYSEYAPYEIYKTDDFEYFKNTHITLWNTFNQTFDQDKVYIFECIFLQNHINELILKFNLTQEEKNIYFQELSSQIKNTNPKLIYLNQTHVKETFDRIIEERRTDKPEIYKDWITLVIEYFESTVYGKELGYIGYEGALQYFMDRKNEELNIITHLEIESHVFDINGDYDIVFEQIKKAL